MSALLSVCLSLTLVFVPVLVDVGIVYRARAQAENIADAAALAAAQEIVRGGDPAAAAHTYAAHNGGRLVAVLVEDKAVVVTAEEPCTTLLAARLGMGVGPARGRGKAELKEIDEPAY